MTCDRDSIHLYIDGRLAEGERAAVEAHMAECEECASLHRFLREYKAAAAGLADVETPDGLRAAVMRAIKPKRRFNWRVAGTIAASLLVLTIGVFAFYNSGLMGDAGSAPQNASGADARVAEEAAVAEAPAAAAPAAYDGTEAAYAADQAVAEEQAEAPAAEAPAAEEPAEAPAADEPAAEAPAAEANEAESGSTQDGGVRQAVGYTQEDAGLTVVMADMTAVDELVGRLVAIDSAGLREFSGRYGYVYSVAVGTATEVTDALHEYGVRVEVSDGDLITIIPEE